MKGYSRDKPVPKLYTNVPLQQQNVNQPVVVSKKKKQKEIINTFLQRFEEIACQIDEIKIKHDRVANEVCHHMTNQVSFNEWLVKQIEYQESKTEQFSTEIEKRNEENLFLCTNIDQTKEQQSDLSNRVNHLNTLVQKVVSQTGNNDVTELSRQLKEQSRLIEDLMKGRNKEEHSYKELYDKFNEQLQYTKNLEEQLNQLVDEMNRHEEKHMDLTSEFHEHQKSHQELAVKDSEHDKELLELKEKLNNELKVHDDSCEEKGPFVKIFKMLPPNYPVDSVLMNGMSISVTRFLNMNKDTDIAHFTDEIQIKTFDCNKIDGVRWGKNDHENGQLEC